jgi:hypothetical protein
VEKNKVNKVIDNSGMHFFISNVVSEGLAFIGGQRSEHK